MKQEKVTKKLLETVEKEVIQYTVIHEDFILVTTEKEYALKPVD